MTNEQKSPASIPKDSYESSSTIKTTASQELPGAAPPVDGAKGAMNISLSGLEKIALLLAVLAIGVILLVRITT